ncbi:MULTISPECIES: sensor histidine kinase [Microbacterium]|jgi:signal transduction histidine kinase|uniref:sensor histidine kinase n=1 Tax=Microbacterium TaxID=33882 RepID=UPI000E7177EE|nr:MULTISPECIES: GAF domain-containing sensor histidine kinase [Microbacterium]MDF2578636.1 histidine kinase [Microbacterium sp.]RKE59952.1 GAF sensor signal transduction histidine kinase [Microbacterium sp. AG238]WJM15164.1 GAF domain-containing sensor histidine kinase [Microbacterium arborescens]
MVTELDISRREAIDAYHVIGEAPAPDLQGIVRLAATVCGVDTAVINIIDDRSQHQIAAVGFEPAVCSREDSMCAAVIARPGRVVVPDARLDDRFSANPFVTGEVAHVRFYASSPLITPAGVAIGTLCVFNDSVGDLDESSRDALDLLAHQVVDLLELRRISRELSESNDQLSRFAGQISHDLRNPLTALTGFLELAIDSPDMDNAPEAARVLARAESAADRMNAMISDILSYARVGGASPQRKRVDLDAVMHAVVEDLDAQISASGADVSQDIDVQPVGDPTLLRAVLQNVVANALKFTAAAELAPRVRVEAHAVPGGWRITVDDNGPGVPPEDRERVFALMERGDSDVDGLGIGLSTCRRVIQAHGGRIGLDDSPLGGARVWILLPDAAAASAA